MYPDIDVPEPVAFFMPHWHSNPLYRGSYSNWGPSYVPGQSENLKATLDGRLWFAGEATTVKYFGSSSVQVRCEMTTNVFCLMIGFLQGAYFEGQSTGGAIAACIQGKGTCGYPSTTIPKNAQPYQSFLTAPLTSPSS